MDGKRISKKELKQSAQNRLTSWESGVYTTHSMTLSGSQRPMWYENRGLNVVCIYGSRSCFKSNDLSNRRLCCDCLMEQVAALSFGGYVYFNPDTPLTAQKIFVSLTLIDIIRHPINFIPHAITVITVTVSGQTFISGIIY